MYHISSPYTNTLPLHFSCYDIMEENVKYHLIIACKLFVMHMMTFQMHLIDIIPYTAIYLSKVGVHKQVLSNYRTFIVFL